jgi:transcriptional regulator with XRE-family HTH domain
MSEFRNENARKQILKEGRTREWLAKQCCITIDSLKHILAGRRSPGRAVVKLMAQSLNCTEEYLLGEEEGMKNTG